jgi:hypothetical protein
MDMATEANQGLIPGKYLAPHRGPLAPSGKSIEKIQPDRLKNAKIQVIYFKALGNKAQSQQ